MHELYLVVETHQKREWRKVSEFESLELMAAWYLEIGGITFWFQYDPENS